MKLWNRFQIKIIAQFMRFCSASCTCDLDPDLSPVLHDICKTGYISRYVIVWIFVVWFAALHCILLSKKEKVRNCRINENDREKKTIIQVKVAKLVLSLKKSSSDHFPFHYYRTILTLLTTSISLGRNAKDEKTGRVKESRWSRLLSWWCYAG